MTMQNLAPQPHVLTDEPKWSSASLCITLKHLGETFRPEYTHQIVEGECWRGHRPLQSVLRRARSTLTSAPAPGAILHKSHENHNTASKQLEIRVTMSPSCQECCVDVVRTESHCGEHNSGIEIEPDAKRRRTNLDSECQQQTNLSYDGTSRETIEQGMKTVLPSPESIPMKESEIISALCKALPPIISCEDNGSQIEDGFLSEPIGDRLEEYSIPAMQKALGNLSSSDPDNNDQRPSPCHFVLTIADGRLPHVSEYHRSIQRLSLLYIENADNVDVANDGDGGFWKIMYIFQKHDEDNDGNEKKGPRYSLVGYFTLFHFIALFHKPDPGLILRVCQALVLPPFQGQGHGRRLLQAVYKLAHSESQRSSASNGDSQFENIIQVNVEDPAPAFVALRNKTDFELVLEHYEEWNWPEKGSMWSSVSSHTLASSDNLALFFSAMTEKEASEISVKAKITPKQIHIANELVKLKAIHAGAGQQLDKINRADREKIERFFRLMVKRRLNKEHRDQLLEEPTKDDQKALLAKLFDKELLGYEKILSKLLV